jgi:hypothetical protein
MFIGTLIPCDSTIKSEQGKYYVFGTYSAVTVNGPHMEHTFTLYLRMISAFTGRLDCMLRIFDRTLGNDQQPLMAAPIQFNITSHLTVEGDAVPQVIETQIIVPKVQLALPVEKIHQLDTMQMIAPLDFILSTNGHEMARATVLVIFNKAKP